MYPFRGLPGYRIQASYEDLDFIAEQLNRHALDLERLLQQVGQHVHWLQVSGWSGRGADYFYDEMRFLVFPIMFRLIEALELASFAIVQIGNIYRMAERESARAIGMYERVPLSVSFESPMFGRI